MFSNNFTQNIPCRARNGFLEHVFRRVQDYGQFEIVIESHRHPGPRYTVQVTNEPTVTYFSGATWSKLVNDYELMDGETIVFTLLHVNRLTYFNYEDPKHYEDANED